MAPQHKSTTPTAGPDVELDRGCRYLTQLEDMPHPQAERDRLAAVTARFPFRATEYYLNLIDWSDPADPIRRLVVPSEPELDAWGNLDASRECNYTVARGVQHKYPATVLFLCSQTCGGSCRYCFRKRLFGDARDDARLDLDQALAYVAQRPQVTNVLLTGGDPLTLSTERLEQIIAGIVAIPHVRIVRIGSKMPAFNPRRILGDRVLLRMLDRHGRGQARVQLMAHFDHPRELTPEAVAAVRVLREHGVSAVNQCPILAGINDDPHVLRTLFQELSFIGCPQYYVFQCRPTAGNRAFTVPLVRSLALYNEAVGEIPGLAKAGRLVMSHATGKIEIIGADQAHIYLRYHRAYAAADRGRFLICRRDDRACWLDDLRIVAGDERAA